MANSPNTRPPLSTALDRTEFLRWYWLKDELIQFARSLGVRAPGNKHTLSERLAAHLDGSNFHDAPATVTGRTAQLSGSLTASAVIPRGQRCSQAVRRWLSQQLGPSFRFDGAMRDFFSATDGTQTLSDAANHWLLTRNSGQLEIDAQFEYNRFTRTWYEQHPHGDRASLLQAWRAYRNQPVDLRGRA